MEHHLLDMAIVLVGGLAGATVFGFVRPDREDNARAMLSAGLGTLISAACTPMACVYWQLSEIEYKGGVAFGVGLVGMTLCKVVVVSMQVETKGVGPWFVATVKKLFGIQS